MSTQKCNNCGGINREIAKYCKYCGDMLVAKIDTIFSPLEDLVGLDELKNSIVEMVDSTKEFYERSGKDKSTPLNLNVIIVGSAGTGKTKLSEILAKLYFNAGLVEKENPLCIDAVDYSSFMRDFDNNFAKAKDGVLIVDNIEKLVSKEESQEIHNLDKLLNRMEKSKNNPVVILCGRQTDGTKKFIDTPGVKTLFHIFKLEDLSPEQMHEIAIKQFKQLGFSLQKEADEKLFKLFKHLVKTKDSSFANGKEVEKRVDDIIKKHSSRITPSRPDNRKIQDEDIEGDIPEERTEEEILKALDSLIGLAEIKKTIRDLINQVKMEQDRIKKGLSKKTSISMHMVFTGNPGTGKTTVAKLLGEILAAIGVLPKGHVVTVDKSGLIAEYVGQTAPKVNKAVDEAMGGILFIDEAYGLVDNMKGGYGNDAIETLLQRMENDRGKFIVIAAGYPKEMEEFLNSNQGLRSRFNRFFHFEDYKPDELLEIYKVMAKAEKYTIDPEAEIKLKQLFNTLYSTRDKNFANGRTVRNIFQRSIILQSNRLVGVDNENELSIIRKEDIPDVTTAHNI
ncbi:MAG TPA: AAA family ATPase [Candidatus Ratteibacteria bacterium]|nr:AAA family ATPase [Candidatus Ratteibacteria bacterium]